MSILLASLLYKYLLKKNIIKPGFKPYERIQLTFLSLRTNLLNLF